jgi:hypothetical protein
MDPYTDFFPGRPAGAPYRNRTKHLASGGRRHPGDEPRICGSRPVQPAPAAAPEGQKARAVQPSQIHCRCGAGCNRPFGAIAFQKSADADLGGQPICCSRKRFRQLGLGLRRGRRCPIRGGGRLAQMPPSLYRIQPHTEQLIERPAFRSRPVASRSVTISQPVRSSTGYGTRRERLPRFGSASFALSGARAAREGLIQMFVHPSKEVQSTAPLCCPAWGPPRGPVCSASTLTTGTT